ncbi:MAG: hypothetical protein J2P37_22780 [Ktedonobacteraceae bacterium]|nr:hypothetical protein [Ktedonobacteraceae bacterium]
MDQNMVTLHALRLAGTYLFNALEEIEENELIDVDEDTDSGRSQYQFVDQVMARIEEIANDLKRQANELEAHIMQALKAGQASTEQMHEEGAS